MSTPSLNLGHIIPPGADANKDATHIAVAPVVAGQRLQPGQHVTLDSHGMAIQCAVGSGIGIVDPFLRDAVESGQRFWLWMTPGTITGLRHDWSHPAFKVARAACPVVVPPVEQSFPMIAVPAAKSKVARSTTPAPKLDDLPNPNDGCAACREDSSEEGDDGCASCRESESNAETRAESEAWLISFAKEWAMDYNEMVESAKAGSTIIAGFDLHSAAELGDDYPLFWAHLEIVADRTFSDAHRTGTSFSCSCS